MLPNNSCDVNEIDFQTSYYETFLVCSFGVAALGCLVGKTVHWLTKENAPLVNTNIVETVFTDNQQQPQTVPDLCEQIKEIKPRPERKISVEGMRRISPRHGLTLCGWGRHKEVYSVATTPLVLKIAKEYNPQMYVKEHAAYLVSEYLNLKVVPFTACVDKGKCNNAEILEKFPQLCDIIKDFPKKFMVIQECKKYAPDGTKLNLVRAHEVLFFNLIAGRGDSKEANSVIEEDGMIWEIDNDQIGSKLDLNRLKLHWLWDNKTGILNTPISNDLIKRVLDVNRQNMWDGIQSQYPNTRWSEKIMANLGIVKTTLRKMAKSKPITFESLLTALR